MTNLRRTLSRTYLVTAVLLTTPLVTTGNASAGEAGCTSSVPYVSGEGGYDTYRIPATVTTPRGTVLAFAEGRHDGAGDTGDIDVILRRSLDGGCTWGPQAVVASGDGDTRGNPAPVVDPRTGAVVLVTSYNSGDVTEAQIMRGEATPEQSRRVFVQRSADDGRHFSSPRDITGQVKPSNWRWYATGPGHAIALRHGPHAGRLVVPSNHSAAPAPGSGDTGQEPKYYGAHAIYSDDGGRSWRRGSSTTRTTVSATRTSPRRPNFPTAGCTSTPGTNSARVPGTGSTATPVTVGRRWTGRTRFSRR